MKKLFLILLTAFMLLSLCACTAGKPGETTAAAGEAAALKTFTLVVVHADGTEKTFTYETDEQYVGPVLTEAGMIQGNAGPYGMEITHVDGEQAIYDKDKAYWAVYEGEEYALQGIDTTPVKDGGVYKLVYTKG